MIIGERSEPPSGLNGAGCLYIIAERLSVRQLIPRRISEIVCMYVCMYVSVTQCAHVTLRNAILHNAAKGLDYIGGDGNKS